MTLADAIEMAEEDVKRARAEFVVRAGRIRDRMAQALAYVENGDAHLINSLGELQAQGPDLDRLCAQMFEREAALKTLRMIKSSGTLHDATDGVAHG